jgi:arylsulfatase A-like enzyme
MNHINLLAALLVSATVHGADRPNILWISIEDTSPWFGFCGEKYATTPNLDRLARNRVYYNNAFGTAPVCSPSRFAIITGCYATSYGTQRLRSQFPIPDTVKGVPAYLRQAGYFCSNNSKTHYNTSAEKRLITAVDKRVGVILAELEKDGLKDDMIVFFWPDHSQGIPRG